MPACRKTSGKIAAARCQMSDKISVQYVGFEAKASFREYSFVVHQANGSREFTLAIFNEAFSSRRISFQDAPGFCSAKLRRELAIFANDPPQTQYKITELELDEYRNSHAKPAGGFHPRKPEADL
jgi:hypothetical protein